RLREGSRLPPAGHATVDEPRVAREARVGAEAQALGDAGTEALDEGVGLLDEAEHRLDAVGLLQIHGDRAAAPVHEVELRRLWDAEPRVARAIDADDVGAELGEEHRAERAGADAGELDDLRSGEWTHRPGVAERLAACTGAANGLDRAHPPALGGGHW